MPPYPDPDFSCTVLNFPFSFYALLKAGTLQPQGLFENDPRKYAFGSPQIFASLPASLPLESVIL